MTYRKKLIEVALPLEAINRESAREKGNPFWKGHPRNMHQWWARRPLVACRAILFASLVDDPSGRTEEFPTQDDEDRERERLFGILEKLSVWENSDNEDVLGQARAEILKSTNGDPPLVLDPFCGGGSIPLEAQRLGLQALASDLNPVAVVITKALIEIPARFANRPAVGPDASLRLISESEWRRTRGLAEDVRFYARWIRERAADQIGDLYPRVRIPGRDGMRAAPIAWIWARTVPCPNPACGAEMPLARFFNLAMKRSHRAWVDPIIDEKRPSVSFVVHKGEGEPQEGTVGRRGARCLVCGTSVPLTYIREAAGAGRMAARLMAVVAGAERGRLYLSPDPEQERAAVMPIPDDVPDTELPQQALGFRVQLYGMRKHRDLFTPRQLLALKTLSDLVVEAHTEITKDSIAAGLDDDNISFQDGGSGARAYADAVSTYLAFAVDKASDYGNTICAWNPQNENVGHLFTKQAIPMCWDFVEASLLEGGLAFDKIADGIADSISKLPTTPPGEVKQLDAMTSINGSSSVLICTDPPYYANMGYADLSDFFYVWLRRSLRRVFPDIFSTLLTPKNEELVANPYRFDGDRRRAELFFEEGLGRAFEQMRAAHHPAYPITIYYAFKQLESNDRAADGDDIVAALVSTGWETMLQGLIQAGFSVVGTWPIRTERSARSVGIGTNALASSIVLVCRERLKGATPATRREFAGALRKELPEALRELQHGNIAPVDLAQAAIGPGMGVFSRYTKVLEADGSVMRVRTALALINQTLDEVLAEQESEYDPSTRWAIAWFEQVGMQPGDYGMAETLSKAKNTAINGLVKDGFVQSKNGKVRLLNREELAVDWDPTTDRRLTIWEVTQHLVRALENEGERVAAEILGKVGSLGEIARDLAYRLYTTCERKKWAQDALGYNALVVAWPEIRKLTAQKPGEAEQGGLFG